MIDPRDVQEIIQYYTYYGDDTEEKIKKEDILKLGKECVRLREVLEEASKEGLKKSEIKEIVKEGLGTPNTKKI